MLKAYAIALVITTTPAVAQANDGHKSDQVKAVKTVVNKKENNKLQYWKLGTVKL